MIASINLILIHNFFYDKIKSATIVSRCEKINDKLSVAKGRVPAISLSIEIAHGDEDDTTDTLLKKKTRFLIKT